jgi:hypothetical protein
VTAPRNTWAIVSATGFRERVLLWDDVAHVVAGKEQKIRFAKADVAPEWLRTN